MAVTGTNNDSGGMNICCPKPIRGESIKLTRLDDCGVALPEDTPMSRVFTDAFVSLAFSPDTEEDDIIEMKLANGRYCLRELGDARLLGFEVKLMLCGFVTPILEMLLGGQMLPHKDDPLSSIGFVLPNRDNNLECDDFKRAPYQLEVWSRNGTDGNCDDDPANAPFVRFILPKTFRWVLSSDISFENGSYVEVELTGYAEQNTNFQVQDDDPDLDAEMHEYMIQNGGPITWLCTKHIDESNCDDCGYVEVADAA